MRHILSLTQACFILLFCAQLSGCLATAAVAGAAAGVYYEKGK